MRQRPYQQISTNSAIEALQLPENNRTTMLIAPTGAGKTFMLSVVVNEMLNIIGIVKGRKPRALVLVHRNQINEQNEKAFRHNYGRKTSFFAGDMKSLAGQVVFGMVQTLALVYKKLPPFDFIVIDEFHHSAAESYQNIIEDQKKKNPNLYIFGVTATPNRGDKKGLYVITNNFCGQILIQDLIELGYLVPIRYESIKLFFLDKQVNKIGHPDFYQLGAQELIKAIKRNPERRKIAVFACDVEHMQYLDRALNEAGIKTTSISSDMGDADVRRNLALFEQSDIQALVNIDIATEGYDYPPIDCVALMRRVGNKGLYVQILGRGLRTIDISKYPGYFKKDCLVLDFGDNIKRFGELREDVDLYGKTKLPTQIELAERNSKGDTEAKPIFRINLLQSASLHQRSAFESFTYSDKYVRGVCGINKSLFIFDEIIWLKNGREISILNSETEAFEKLDEILGNDKDFIEDLKNKPIESYQIKLLLDKFDIVGCSKYRASVLINFLAVKGLLCKPN